MPQSLIGLPKEADIMFYDWIKVRIRDHQFEKGSDIFDATMYIVNERKSHRDILIEFEKYGISFETIIEECVCNLENDTDVLTQLICHHYEIKETLFYDDEIDCWDRSREFSESETGGKIVNQLVEMIRSCGNWGELYEHMHLANKFQKDLKSRVIGKMEQ